MAGSVGWLVEPSFGTRLSDSDFMTVLFKWIFAYGIANSIKYKLSISVMIMVAVAMAAIVCGKVRGRCCISNESGQLRERERESDCVCMCMCMLGD